MPLIHSKSKEAFSENVRREVHAGKPQKQAVAIAYAVKREKDSKGKSHFNPFAESWRAKNKARHEALASKTPKVGEGKSHITGNIYKHA